MVICLHQQVEIAAKGPCYYAFFLYYVRVIKPHAALEVEDKPYLRSSFAFMLLWSAKKSLEFYHPYSYNREKKGETQEKKKGETHSFSKNVWETKWWNWEFGSWAVFLENEESHPPVLF